jgi:GNAT superfamily N-acetyltransferase
VVGAALSRPVDGTSRADLLGLGVMAGWRRQGLAGRLLAAHVASWPAGVDELAAAVNIAERDPRDPLDGRLRRDVARRLFEAARFTVRPADAGVRAADPAAIVAVRART